MNNLVIIPARFGSKGIKNKNIKKIAGKPLIAWSIESALKADNVDRVIVSTDSREIADISKGFGAEVPFLRPSRLADDFSTTESAMLHALSWLESNEKYFPDNIILLQATSPVRHEGVIDRAVEKFLISHADSLVSVCEFWHFLWEGQNNPKALYDHKNRQRRQDLSSENVKFKENGSIYITKSQSFKKAKNRLCGKISTFLMKEEESIEIDTHLDWLLVEAILNNNFGVVENVN